MAGDAEQRRTDMVEPDISGRSLGDFRLLRRLGRGAMAEVYLAEQCSLHRQVAVKVLKSQLASDATYVKRFQREAQAAASLVHANIVQIHEVGCIDGAYFIAQEYVQGMNLRQWVTRHGTTDLRMALIVMRQVAAALAKAAEQGIVHRDIKPENIMLARTGEVKVADFGLARLPAAEGVDLTQVGTTLGTPLYMSPEQVEGKPLDPRSDLYSLGVTCYYMLAGTLPFSGETALAVAVQHLKKPPEPLENRRCDLPPALCRMVHKMLAKAPENRYQSARELLRDLRQLQQEHLGDQWPEELVAWEAAELSTLAFPRHEATERLSTIMQTVAMNRIERPRWARWALACLATFAVGLAAAFLTTRGEHLLASAKDSSLPIPKQETVGAQWLYASQLGTEDAWRAVVEYFPDKRYWGYRAKQHLARIYLKEDHDAPAMAIFKEFALLDDTEEELRAFGLAGQCWILTKQGQYRQSAEVLGQLLPIRSKLKDSLMRQMLNYAISKNRAMLGPLTVQEWQAWLDRQRQEEGG
jgi:serine/threonine-protein kinase